MLKSKIQNFLWILKQGADVMDENDLLEIGILSSEHRQRILEASSKQQSVPVSG
jgi:SAM domain (Sterile alpha motif)